MIEQMSDEEWEKWSKEAHKRFAHLKRKVEPNIIKETSRITKKQGASTQISIDQIYNND